MIYTKQPQGAQWTISPQFQPFTRFAYSFDVNPTKCGLKRDLSADPKIINVNTTKIKRSNGAPLINTATGKGLKSDGTASDSVYVFTYSGQHWAKSIELESPNWIWAYFCTDNIVANTDKIILSLCAFNDADTQLGIKSNCIRYTVKPRDYGGEASATLFTNVESPALNGYVWSFIGQYVNSTPTGWAWCNGVRNSLSGSTGGGNPAGGTGWLQTHCRYHVSEQYRADWTLLACAYGEGIVPEILAKELSLNPWSMFSKSNKPIFSDMGAGSYTPISVAA